MLSDAVNATNARLKIVMAIAARGTYFGVIFPFKILLHISEPTIIPTVNVPMNRLVTFSFAKKVSFAKVGNCVRKIVPTNQNQEMPKTDKKTVLSLLAIFIILTVSARKFGLIFKSGEGLQLLGCRDLR